MTQRPYSITLTTTELGLIQGALEGLYPEAQKHLLEASRLGNRLEVSNTAHALTVWKTLMERLDNLKG